MSGPIVRSGPSSGFTQNWESIFGKKSAKKKDAKKKETKKPAAAKKSATKKAGKKKQSAK